MITDNNKRIAKNTLFLYIRMFFIMAVTLYTSRIILKVLGVEDFGIYNVVAGIVIMFSFLNNAMVTSTQRFLNYELGREKTVEVARIFSMSFTAHIIIVVGVIILSETVGLWFLNSQMNIPKERINAANWVYQFSILVACVQILRSPYNACIIAYEKMSFYAYISIVEVCLKLLIVYILIIDFCDKLILYAMLLFIVSLLVLAFYKYYCNKYFKVSLYHYFWDKSLFLRLMSFSGWSLFGSAANVGASQGLNILLNIFYGVAVNAAMGIANQFFVAVNSFIANFQTAFNPQIVKSYAANNDEGFMNLVFHTSKYSYFLLLFISLPLFICCPFVIEQWLGVVPEHTVAFCRLMILFSLIDALSGPLWISVQATGNIRFYQILMGSLIFMNLPLCWLVLYLGFVPETVLVIRVLINALTYFTRIGYLKIKLKFSTRKYIKEVILTSVFVTLLSVPIPLLVAFSTEGWYQLLLTVLLSSLFLVFWIYFIGLAKDEKEFIKILVSNKIKK